MSWKYDIWLCPACKMEGPDYLWEWVYQGLDIVYKCSGCGALMDDQGEEVNSEEEEEGRKSYTSSL